MYICCDRHYRLQTECNKRDTAEDYQQNHTGQLTVNSESVHHMTEYILTGGAYLSAMYSRPLALAGRHPCNRF